MNEDAMIEDGQAVAQALYRCWRCGVESPACDFPKDATRKDQRGNACRACRSAMNRAYYEAHKDAILQQHRERREHGPAKHKAKRKRTPKR